MMVEGLVEFKEPLTVIDVARMASAFYNEDFLSLLGKKEIKFNDISDVDPDDLFDILKRKTITYGHFYADEDGWLENEYYWEYHYRDGKWENEVWFKED